jgi:hypothetical protein
VTPQARLRQVLGEQLNPLEVRTIIAVWRAELRGEPYSAGRLGIAASLERRGWLVRDDAGHFHLSERTGGLLR